MSDRHDICVRSRSTTVERRFCFVNCKQTATAESSEVNSQQSHSIEKFRSDCGLG